MKRRASTKAKVVQNFDEVKAQFLFDIKVVVEMDEIPSDLVINCDQLLCTCRVMDNGEGKFKKGGNCCSG